MIVLDVGGLKYGYGSDTTRTVNVGKPTAEEWVRQTPTVNPARS